MIGENLLHYEIQEKIGAGGMGEVYRAHDSKLRRDVALKLLPPEVVHDPDKMARFEREARSRATDCSFPESGTRPSWFWNWWRAKIWVRFLQGDRFPWTRC